MNRYATTRHSCSTSTHMFPRCVCCMPVPTSIPPAPTPPHTHAHISRLKQRMIFTVDGDTGLWLVVFGWHLPDVEGLFGRFGQQAEHDDDGVGLRKTIWVDLSVHTTTYRKKLHFYIYSAFTVHFRLSPKVYNQTVQQLKFLGNPNLQATSSKDGKGQINKTKWSCQIEVFRKWIQ